ncbi:glutamic acid-rich protein-like [Hyposmocoma kahamanoa]|uniref:glutamic acid-rich protein-like n=1 Tax=Hyposmocoma kahamanoa TaxID=1477025 RepID=UPI000E6D9460|nr:glutamic acid-rich protein-like [Hyposmocoma kahamanoa]
MVKEDRKNHHCRSTFKTSTIRVQKDVDLKTCFFIYRQSKNTKTSDTNGTRNAGDSDGNEDFKTEYTNNTKMMTADIVSAIDQNEVSCPRCRYIMHHAQKTVRQLSVAERIFPNNICEHCQAKAKDPFPKTKEELVYSRLKSEGKLLRRRKKEKNTFVSLSNIRRDLQKSKLPRIDPRITPLISSLKLDDKSLSDVESPVNQDSNILMPPKYDDTALEEESGICIKTKKAHDKRFFAGNKDDDMEKKKLDEKREKAETLNKKQRKEGILDSSTGEKEKYSKRKLSKTSETELSKIDDGINQDKKKRQKYNDNEASGKDRKGVNYEERTYNKKKENENEKIDKEKTLPGKGLSSPGKGKKRSGNDIVSPKDISNRDKTLSFPEEGLHKEEEQNKKKWYLEPGKEKKMPVKGEVLTAVEKRLPVSKKNSDKEEALLPSKQISDKEKSLSPHKKGLQEQQVENEDKSYKKKELPTFEKELLHGKKEGKSDEEQIRYLASGQKEKHTLDGAKKEKLNNSKTKINVIPADDELLVGKMDKTKPKPLKSKSITRPAAIKPRHKKLENIESQT